MSFYFIGKPQPHSVFYNYIVLENQLDFVIKNSAYSVIDVNCYFPQYLFHIYSMIGKKKFVGLEHYSESEVSFGALKNLLRLKNDEVTKKVYNIFSAFTHLTKPNYFSQYPMLTEQEFNQVFDLRFSIDVDDTVKKMNEKFDYLILNNVIHLKIAKEKYKLNANFFNDSINLLKPHGLIYVKANHQDNPDIKDINQVHFTEDEFKSLFAEKFDEIYYDLEEGKNKVKLRMVYFGKLK